MDAYNSTTNIIDWTNQISLAGRYHILQKQQKYVEYVLYCWLMIQWTNSS